MEKENRSNLQDIQSNSVRFMKMNLHNYGIFWGSHDFVFDRQRTVIVGACGTGKTTIVDALAHLGPAPEVEPNFRLKAPEMSVDVVTRGDRDLVKRFGSLIFLDCEARPLFHNKQDILAAVLDDQQQKMIRDESREIFRTLVAEKPGTNELHDLSTSTMALGEKVCYGFAYSFAVRKVLHLDLPAVFDRPYACLDIPLRRGVCAFLKRQLCQQILLGSESEFEELDEPYYKLNHAGSY